MTTDELLSLGLTENAAAWLHQLYHATHIFDDVYDNDAISAQDKDIVIWNALVGMPGNQFYIQYQQFLIPLLASALLRWQSANAAEKAKRHNAMTFAWRDGFYDIVLMCVYLEQGYYRAIALSEKILAMNTELFSDYMEEFKLRAI